MASKVLVPAAPFTKLQVKKSPPEQSGSGFIIGGNDAVARVAHLEHSVRFLQEQHRLMLSGLHAEIEALRERNRDLQFQLIFNKESSPKPNSPTVEDNNENNEEANLKVEVSRLEREAAAARGEARAAEARALQLQRLVDAQAEKLRDLEVKTSAVCGGAGSEPASLEHEADETRAELRARLADAERLVRRLRGDAERQRRELQCMKNSLHASLRASGLEGAGVGAGAGGGGAAAFGYQNTYHFPPLQTADMWREPLREEFSMPGPGARGPRRRPLTLPELAGQQIHRSTIYANNHTRPRANGYDHKTRKGPGQTEPLNTKSPEEPLEHTRLNLFTPNDIPTLHRPKMNSMATYPELKVVVTKLILFDKVSSVPGEGGPRPRPRRHHHRKHAPDTHT